MGYAAKITARTTRKPVLRVGGRLAVLGSVLTAAAIAVSAAIAGPAAASTSADGAGTVGVADPSLLGESASVQSAQLSAMSAAGINSVRIDANWDWVQYGGKKSFDWSQLDQAVSSIRAAGMSVDLIIDGCPPWAAVASARNDPSPQPASAAAYATWAAEVAARYAPQGVTHFEIWNEPNNAGFWQPKPSPAAYTADLKAAYTAIKAADPGAFVISGGLAPETSDGSNISPITFLKDMYADGAHGSFDALGDHPYSYPALPDTKETWSGWSQMSQTSTSIRSLMTANGDGAKQVWITEVGAPTGGPDAVSPAAQADDMTQAITAAQNTSWIGGIYLYTWKDSGSDQSTDQDWFGLTTASGTAKPALAAVSKAIGAGGS